MPYSEFALQTVVDRFGLILIERNGAYETLPPVGAISAILATLLREQVPLAVAINTEKARSEMIVVNVLAEVRRQLPGQISIFSGVELDVEKSESLNGYCDFLISLSTQQMMVSAPIVALVEAKNDNLPAAWGQCAAEMIAAQRFNERRGNAIATLYGVVTSGTAWMFGSLEGKTLSVDLHEYGIDEPERICGILIAMVRQAA
jgi:hypothetical protein